MITERGVLYALVILFGLAAGYLLGERHWLTDCELEGTETRLLTSPTN